MRVLQNRSIIHRKCHPATGMPLPLSRPSIRVHRPQLKERYTQEAAVKQVPCPECADTPQVCVVCPFVCQTAHSQVILLLSSLTCFLVKEKEAALHSLCNLPSFALPHAKQLGRLGLREIWSNQESQANAECRVTTLPGWAACIR